MNNNILATIAIVMCALYMIWIIINHNKSVKQSRINQLRDIKSKINNALSLLVDQALLVLLFYYDRQ